MKYTILSIIQQFGTRKKLRLRVIFLQHYLDLVSLENLLHTFYK